MQTINAKPIPFYYPFSKVSVKFPRFRTAIAGQGSRTTAVLPSWQIYLVDTVHRCCGNALAHFHHHVFCVIFLKSQAAVEARFSLCATDQGTRLLRLWLIRCSGSQPPLQTTPCRPRLLSWPRESLHVPRGMSVVMPRMLSFLLHQRFDMSLLHTFGFLCLSLDTRKSLLLRCWTSVSSETCFCHQRLVRLSGSPARSSSHTCWKYA